MPTMIIIIKMIPQIHHMETKENTTIQRPPHTHPPLLVVPVLLQETQEHNSTFLLLLHLPHHTAVTHQPHHLQARHPHTQPTSHYYAIILLLQHPLLLTGTRHHQQYYHHSSSSNPQRTKKTPGWRSACDGSEPSRRSARTPWSRSTTAALLLLTQQQLPHPQRRKAERKTSATERCAWSPKSFCTSPTAPSTRPRGCTQSKWCAKYSGWMMCCEGMKCQWLLKKNTCALMQ